MAKIAVLGYGTVGSGVVEILDANAECIYYIYVMRNARLRYRSGLCQKSLRRTQ